MFLSVYHQHRCHAQSLSPLQVAIYLLHGITIYLLRIIVNQIYGLCLWWTYCVMSPLVTSDNFVCLSIYRVLYNLTAFMQKTSTAYSITQYSPEIFPNQCISSLLLLTYFLYTCSFYLHFSFLVVLFVAHIK